MSKEEELSVSLNEVQDSLYLGAVTGYKRLYAAPTPAATQTMDAENPKPGVLFRSAYSGAKATYPQNAEAFCFHDMHPSPTPGCRCGWNASNKRTELSDAVKSEWKSIEGLFEAKVELYGKFVRHDTGIRASKQRVVQLWAHHKCALCSRDAALLGTHKPGTPWFPFCGKHAPDSALTVEQFSEATSIPTTFEPSHSKAPTSKVGQDAETKHKRFKTFVVLTAILGLLHPFAAMAFAALALIIGYETIQRQVFPSIRDTAVHQNQLTSRIAVWHAVAWTGVGFAYMVFGGVFRFGLLNLF